MNNPKKTNSIQNNNIVFKYIILVYTNYVSTKIILKCIKKLSKLTSFHKEFCLIFKTILPLDHGRAMSINA